MKKLLLILLLSSISTQTIARVGEVYHCEFYSYVHIPSKENTYNDDINTNWLGEKSKKFTFLREENQIILNSKEGDRFNYAKIPINLTSGYKNEVDEYFSGADYYLDIGFHSFMSIASSRGSTTDSTFYYTHKSHSFLGGIQSGIAECTH
jgi:hypothetical protein